MESRKIEGYGWARDLPDQRDRVYSAPFQSSGDLPDSFDLSPMMPPVYNQNRLGSCTANAIGAVIEFQTMNQKELDFTPSRLFIYYGERAMEGTIAYDSGAQIRDGIKFVAQSGVCPETEWPYDISQFTVRPTDTCWTDANQHLALVYESVNQNLAQIKGCIASNFPIVFGFTVYQSFESPVVSGTGIMPLPQSGESTIGGHAVVCVGFDDSKQMFKIRNSWGPEWSPSLGGYFWMPYSFMLDSNQCDDFWCVKVVK